MPQDLRLETLELRPRLDPELVDEAAARGLVGVEGLGLAAGSVEREHQLPAEGLAQRMLAHERLQLADDVAVAPQLQVGVDPLLERHEPELLEPSDLRLRELLERELGERGAAPEVERAPEQRAPLLGARSAGVAKHELEAASVDASGVDAQDVARRTRLQDVRPELATQPRDRVLERCRCRLRRVLAPEQVDQAIGGDHATRLDQQGREKGPLLLPAHDDRAAVALDLERAEDPEFKRHEDI